MPTDEVTDEQRGYDRAIAEVVAWLRAKAEIHRSEWAVSVDAGVAALATAIEAGEHKP
jgi:hypothetical protein